jgi:putative methionine-R-sulfoxide reductase with GAF domain
VHAQPHAGALEAVERVLNRESEADEVLRQTVEILADRIDGYTWVGLYLVEDGGLVLGPSRGTDTGGARLEADVVYDRMHVATLAVVTGAAAAEHDQAFLDRIAVLISAHCLVGWDTGGVPWPEGEPTNTAQ